MKNVIYAGNWKMNKTNLEAESYADEILNLIEQNNLNDKKIIICPPFTSINTLAKKLKGSNVKVGAQDIFSESNGTFTGCISAEMVAGAGAEYVIIGHSDRRNKFGESDEIVAKKVNLALGVGLKPILCVGETLQQRNDNMTMQVLTEQLTIALADVAAADYSNIIIAYEPVWAISSGKVQKGSKSQAANSATAGLDCMNIRKLLRDKFGESTDAIAILYGGSMNSSNCKEFFAQDEISGGLMGAASLSASDFIEVMLNEE
ncbi:MAG: triose-phosphate isomerase [Clostridiales bacterium]|jgi:triosephosphate isomerase|nr:triose-phosphate isomerase [Clostridiales bacterium]